MAYELRDGQGSLFKNKHKTTDNHPNARGELMLDGVLYEVSAWTKKTKTGEPWQSLQVKRKEPRAPAEPAWGSDRKAEPGFDDEVPF
jgi:hypothetical protein